VVFAEEEVPVDSTSVVRKFIVDTFLCGDASRLTSPDLELFGCGIRDTIDMLEVATFLEAYFGIEISDTELLPENLSSVEKITAFVERKQATRLN
jgi:acyl carrier protein